MKKLLLSITLALIILSISPSSNALGKMGLRALCQLSYDLLPKAQQGKIDQLLQALPVEEKQRINQYNYLKKDQKVTFANSCTWADAIKKDDSYDNFKPWHYLNISRKEDIVLNETCQSNCLTAAITFHNQQLSTEKELFDKTKAMMFLGHWLGDIHQPLHVSYASDLGGNKVEVEPFIGRCSNLHWYWDQCLLFSRNKTKEEKTSAYYQTMYRELYQQLSHQLAKAPLKEWQQNDISQWASESLNLIRNDTFNYCHISNKTCESLTKEKVMLSKDYHQKYSQVLKTRILQGATRLAKLLDAAL